MLRARDLEDGLLLQIRGVGAHRYTVAALRAVTGVELAPSGAAVRLADGERVESARRLRRVQLEQLRVGALREGGGELAKLARAVNRVEALLGRVAV